MSSSQIPSIQNFIDDSSSLPELLDGRQLIQLHERRPDRSYPSDGPESYVTSAAKISKPVDEVKEAVTNFSNWENIIEFIEGASRSSLSGDEFLVEFKLGLTMGIINPSFNYELRYRELDNGDLIWAMERGDLTTHEGRWEFIPISENETLLAYTLYTDFTGSGFMVNTVLWAQPDLKIAMPITLAGVFLRSFIEHFREKPSAPPVKSPRIPQVGKLKDNALETFCKLTDSGLPMILHSPQLVEAKEDNCDLLFTSAGARVGCSSKKAKDLLTQFERYPEFIEQVSNVDLRNTDEEFTSSWSFKLGFGILSMTINFDIDYRWVNDRTLELKLVDGDFEKIYGHLEWIPIDASESVYTVTTASIIGPDAPSLVQVANMVPYRQVFMGTTLGTVVLEKSVDWVHDQLQEKTTAD